MRITKNELENYVNQLNEEQGNKPKEIDSYRLISSWGGTSVAIIANELGGVQLISAVGTIKEIYMFLQGMLYKTNH